MTVHILAENRTTKRSLLAEHGLSLFIRHERGDILFDTGQSDVFLRNAGKMNVGPGKSAYIILSHGHYDHCGGIVHFPFGDTNPAVYVHRNAFDKKFSYKKESDTFSYVGIPWSDKESERLSPHLVLTQGCTKIQENIYLLGEIPGTVSFEGVPQGFYLNESSKNCPDMIKDEQMLVIDGEKGLVIFLGCSHPGVINCLHYAQRKFPGKKIEAVIGGMHLGEASDLRVAMTIEEMIDMDIRKVIPLHCTGITAMCRMKRFLKERCLLLCAGDTFEV